MQIYLPNINTKQGAIGLFDYFYACKNCNDANVIFNSDLNLQDLNDQPGGNKELCSPEPVDDSALDFLSFVLVNYPDSSAQIFQDLYVQWKLQGKKQGYFIEIGTAHPDSKNNTFYLETSLAWNGVCVEPNPVFHKSIKECRSAPLEPSAILSTSQDNVSLKIYHKFDPGGGIDIDFEFKDMPEDLSDFVSVNVSTINLVDCLEKYQVNKNFDYLSYDTTGNIDDVVSIQQMLDRGYLPSIITIGHNYKSHRPELHKILEEHNYIREFDYFSRWDDWYYHPKLLSS